MKLRKQLYAYITEHSDDGGETWEIDAIGWHIGATAKQSREIPWMTRMRHVLLFDLGIVPNEEVKRELEIVDKLDEVLAKMNLTETKNVI
jgi:hypothetical protein